MPVHPIIARLAAAESLPRQEIEACRADRESLVPLLLDTLRRIADDAADIELEEYEALFWIVHLLGEFGETAAFAPLIELVRDDPEWVEDDLDDAVTATLPGVLIRTFDGDYERLEGLIEDELADEFLRAAAFEAWIYLTAQGRIERDHAETYLRQCADYRLEPRDGCYVWSVWLSAAAYLGFADLADLVQTACDRRWIDPEHGTYADFQQMLARTAAGGEMTEHLHRDSIKPFTDTIAEFERWTFGPDDEPEASPFQPVINPYRHVGRNDPCPCGSGRKFKKCCGGITLH